MPAYRLYYFAENLAFAEVVILNCPDDEAALEAAREHTGSRPMELWHEARLVQRFEPASS